MSAYQGGRVMSWGDSENLIGEVACGLFRKSDRNSCGDKIGIQVANSPLTDARGSLVINRKSSGGMRS